MRSEEGEGEGGMREEEGSLRERRAPGREDESEDDDTLVQLCFSLEVARAEGESFIGGRKGDQVDLGRVRTLASSQADDSDEV